ncbi:MAG: phosphotransferase [Bdellovibrionales bacterium]|nr:phosphotransferase [Bdellovibrionales bacterium]
MSSLLSREITQFIAKHVGGADFECLQLAGDASTRKYYRIIYGDQPLVLMSWEPFSDPDNYPFLNVQAHFAKMDVRVPKVAALEPSLGVVLLEDLGDLTLERKFWENQNQELAMPYYGQAVDEIVKIHFLASKPTQPPSVCQQIQFDTAKFMWEMNYAREHFLEKVGGIQLSAKDQAALQSEFQHICETLDKQPKFVCHRDYHSRNLMLKLGRVYVIDFQDARLGPIQYDLVSLVHDSYVNLSQESIAHIKNDYKEKARQTGPSGAIRSDFDEIFQLQTIQRCFKACGSFASFYNMRNDTRYLKYLKSTASLVATTLNENGRYKLLSGLFASAGLTDRNYDELCAV